MIEIPIASRRFREPTNVVIEASWEAIREFNLDECEGEQFDRIGGCMFIDVSASEVRFVSVRTWEAWKRGEPNAGRGEWIIPRSKIEKILVPCAG